MSIDRVLRDVSDGSGRCRPEDVPAQLSTETAQVAIAVDTALSDLAVRIHDNEMQVLHAVATGLATVAPQLGEPGARARVEFLAELLDRTVENLRRDVLGATRAHQLRLSRRLQAAITDLGSVMGPALRLDLAGPVDSLDDETLADEVVAVVREANLNAIRDAHATWVVTSISLEPTRLLVCVSDNGTGISQARRGGGLRHIQARAERRQGAVKIAPRPGGGTRVEWAVSVRRTGESHLQVGSFPGEETPQPEFSPEC